MDISRPNCQLSVKCLNLKPQMQVNQKPIQQGKKPTTEQWS